MITSTNPAQNYKYNQGTSGTNFQGKEGKSFKVERQLELGLNLDMTKFRMYDYALGRFTSIDPLADANPQESWTPYQYAYNSPIQYNDPYGDCPWCIGALIGAAVDYGLQVAGNLAEGKDLGDALTDIDGTSILISAGAGATGVGLISKIKKTVKTVDKVVKVTTRVTRDGGKGAKIIKKSGKVKDVTTKRVKQFEPAPKNPSGKPNQVNFKKNPKQVPKKSKVLKTDPKKRTPTKKEIKTLKKAKDFDKTQ